MIDRKKVQNSLDRHVFSDNPFNENMKAEMIKGLRRRKNRESRPKKVPSVLKPFVSAFLLAIVAGCMFYYVLGSGQQNHMTSPADFTASLVHYKKIKSELGDALFKKIAKQYATNPEIQNTPWKVSPSFAMRDKDGSLVWQDHDHIKGVKNKIAFINIPDLIHAKSQRDVAKRFWYVWGNSDHLIGKQLTAFAVHQDTGEAFLLDQVKLSPPLYGENASALTEWAAFPSKGMWRIDVFIGGNYFDSIVVNIKSAYIKTDTLWIEGGAYL